MKRKFKKLLKELGLNLDREQLTELAEELEDFIDNEVEKRSKKTEDEPKTEAELMKAEFAKEIVKVKLQAKIDAELSTARIKEGFEDVVKNLIDFDKVKLDEKGKLEGLKNQLDVIVKEKAILFEKGSSGYAPQGGKTPNKLTFEEARKLKDFNFTQWLLDEKEGDE